MRPGARRKRGGGRDPAIGEGGGADLRAVFFFFLSLRPTATVPCFVTNRSGGLLYDSLPWAGLKLDLGWICSPRIGHELR